MKDGTKPRDAVRYLFRLRRFGVKKGFERVERLLQELGNPHEEFDAVQIGGTNGKGSVGRMLESCLLDAGHDVGLYTSPHLLELGERVRVGGERTRKRRIAEFVERVRPCVEEMIAEGDAPTFFEVTTVMAFDEFARRGVDIGVLEVGLGGRFDTTSVCDADVSAVTSVDREHTDVLGENVEEIAWELGHVIPEDGTCVTGVEGEALDVLRSMADERDANLVEVGEDIEYDEPNRDGFEQALGIRTRVSEYEGARLPLLGEHQARNACVAVGLLESVSESLGYEVDDGNVLSGLRTADLPGRFEVVGTDPLVVLDGAHNPAAVDALAETLADFEHDELGVVFGAMCDKEVGEMADRLSDLSPSHVHAVSASTPRAEEASTVARIFEENGDEVRVCGTVAGATSEAVGSASEDDAVLVTGSLSVVAEARRIWSDHATVADYDDEEGFESVLASSGYGAEETVSSSDAVHRTVRLSNLDTETARLIEETASSVGGNAVVSDTGIPGTYPDVSVSATVGEFEEVLDRLPKHVASVVEEALGSERSARSSGTKVMGILNVTPDSFYDGGRYNSLEDAVDRGVGIVEEGGDIVDVGGESTRPGADPVGVEEEKERVVPVVDRLSDEVEVPISVDTRHPEVAREALGAGAEIVNDVTGLENPEMRRLVADEGCRVVVMDSVDVPVDTSSEPVYDDVVDDVLRRLSERVLRARRAGVKDEQIVVDPGIGFGKGSDGDVEVLRRVNEFTSLGYPVLVGCSRKSVFGDSLDFSEEERLEPSIAANVLAASKGAGIVRVHDVEETVRAVEVADLLSRPGCREDSSDNDA